MTDDLTTRVKRLKYRSAHRGTKELDLIFGAFAQHHLDAMSAAEIDQYEAILAADEHDIYGWLTGQVPVPPEHDNEAMAKILSFEFRKTISCT
jgi:antitoxin CptB